MTRYKKKPVVIDAVQFTGTNFAEIQAFTPRSYFRGWTGEPGRFADGKLITAEVYDEIHNKWIPVRAGDWIIRGLKGENYPCDPEIFSDSYEAA